MSKTEKPQQFRGVGLDIGTMNLVSARRTADGIVTKRMRDVFVDLPVSSRKMLKLSQVSFVERGDEVLVLGDAAMEVANVFGSTPRRPLAGGLVSSSERDALEVLKLLILNVLGDPSEPDEVCYYSVPAAPLDQPGRDVIYHQGVFERIVRECGYKPFSANEAMGIVFSECAKEGFSGLAFSFGSGMTNVALGISTLEGLSFSVARGGDWIDQHVAGSVGSTPARICAIKEGGVDLNAPRNREEEAIAFYYKALIEYALDQVALRFKAAEGQFQMPKAVPLIVSGGTALAPGFLGLFKAVFAQKARRFPIEISEIRQAAEPLKAVAYGMLIQAQQEYEG